MSDLTPPELCAELAALYRALGAALAPDTAETPDRSNQARPALLWCATHQAPHRRDEWQDPDTHDDPEDWCQAGQDPRRASVRLAPTLAATAPKWSQAAKTYGGASPLDLEVLGVQEGIHVEALGLARLARRALGHTRRERDPVWALGALPGLMDTLPAGHVLTRRAPAVLDALRRRARVVLDLDRRPFRPGAACPSDREPYAATWAPTPDGQDWEAAAEWTDGICREYDVLASRPDATPAVDVWRVSLLYVRDPGAAPESEDNAVRCPGCRRAWVGAEGKASLYALLGPELEEVTRSARRAARAP